MDYARSFKKGNSVLVDGFEIPATLPDMPSERLIENYNLPSDKQFFKRANAAPWATANRTDRKRIADEFWQKRFEGEWQFIGGEPVYIPGSAWFFFNFWKINGFHLPYFRWEALEYFYVLDHIERDPQCFGSLILKPRRIGDTEKTLCYLTDLTTRYKNSKSGIMSKTEDDAEDAFQRLVRSAILLPPYFMPQRSGMDIPKKELLFQAPSRRITHLTNPDEPRFQSLNSSIDFEATREKAYDGQRLRGALIDEWAKIPFSQMDVAAQMSVLSECVSLEGGARVVGKMIWPSTVEADDKGAEMTGDQVALVKKLWDGSKPNDDGNFTGCYRYFRSHLNVAPVDAFGRHQKDKQAENHARRLEAFDKSGFLEGRIRYLRKYPRTVEDSLLEPEDNCVLFPSLLDQQKAHLELVAAGKSTDRMAIRGDLVWANGWCSDVNWVPNPNGHYWMSQAPERPNMVSRTGQVMPMANSVFCAGVDPVDHELSAKNSRPSNPAITVYRHFDENEVAIKWSEGGDRKFVTNPREIKSGQFCMLYAHRASDPNVFYEAALKVLFFYGCWALIENDKPGFVNFLKGQGLSAFSAPNPKDLYQQRFLKRDKNGQKATIMTKNMGLDLLRAHIVGFYQTIRIPLLLKDFRKFTGTNAKDCDPTVASMLSLQLSQSALTPKKASTNLNWNFSPFEVI